MNRNAPAYKGLFEFVAYSLVTKGSDTCGMQSGGSVGEATDALAASIIVCSVAAPALLGLRAQPAAGGDEAGACAQRLICTNNEETSVG